MKKPANKPNTLPEQRESCANIKLFAAHLQFQKNYSEATVRSYRTDLEEFEAFLQQKGKSLATPPDVEKKDIQDFLDKRGISKIVSIKPNTIIKLTQMQLIGKNSDGKFEILPSTIKRYESFSYWKTNFVEMTSITPTILVNNNMLPKNTSIIILVNIHMQEFFILIATP